MGYQHNDWHCFRYLPPPHTSKFQIEIEQHRIVRKRKYFYYVTPMGIPFRIRIVQQNP